MGTSYIFLSDNSLVSSFFQTWPLSVEQCNSDDPSTVFTFFRFSYFQVFAFSRFYYFFVFLKSFNFQYSSFYSWISSICLIHIYSWISSICLIHISAFFAKSISFAENFTGSGRIKSLKQWFGEICRLVFFIGYYVNSTKAWLKDHELEEIPVLGIWKNCA